MNMTRREAIIKLATLMSASVVGPRLFAADFGNTVNPTSGGEFTAEEQALLDEIGDTIIPTTDVPGAKAVGIGAFMIMMVRDCYTERDQTAFKEGLKKITSLYAERFGGSFMTGQAADRTALLNDLDREQKIATEEAQNNPASAVENQPGPHYFRIMKELTILGYFSSEIGCTQALRFIEVPGRFDGAAPYSPGEHAWFFW